MSQALDEIRAIRADQNVSATSAVNDQVPAESQLGRTFAQGLTFGFADEIEAAVRAVVPESMGGGKYTEVRDELRGKLSDYAEQNPGAALSAELAGAFLPSIVMAIAPVPGSRVAAGSNLTRIASRSAAEAAASSVGYSEADDFSTGVKDVGVGTGIGTAVGVGAEVGLGKLGNLSSKLFNYVRKRMGGADSAVQAELLRLQKATGLSVEEIIADVANGRIMSDNATLSAAIKGMVNEGGETAPQILSASAARRASTTGQAQESLRTALSPDVNDPNLIRARRAREEDLQAEASEAYNKVYAKPESQVTTPEVADQLLNVVRTNPALRADIETFYRNEGFVPLFKDTPNGSIEYARAPTLQDAETARGIIRDEASALFAASKGTLGKQKKQQEQNLKSALDTSSPELSRAVSNYAKMASQRDAFEAGKKKALTRNVDELEVDLEGMNPDDLAAYRAGAMAALTDRARRSGTTLENMAKEDVQLGAALRVLLPEDQTDTVLRDVGRASEAISMDKIIQPRNQSITQALQREAQMRGGNVSMEDVFRGVQGDPMAVTKLVVSMAPSAKGLSDAQMSEVAKILYTESPEMIRQALTDQTVAGAVLRKAEAVISGAAQYGRTAGAQQGAQFGQERL